MIVSPKYINLTLLFLGFGIGQGSLFLANTFLYWTGHYRLVADFGSVNALVSLIVFFGDWGGGTYLAKEALSAKESTHADCSFVALTAFRVLLNLIYVLVLASFLRGRGGFFAAYLSASVPGVIVGSFNPVGLLDGRARSGLAGLTQSLPILAVALALPFCAQLEPTISGLLTGAVMSGFTIISVLIQIYFADIKLSAVRPGLEFSRIARVATQALPYMLTPLPGHILFRGQIYLANVYLSSAAVALFIYARQIVGIGYQATGFYLRVDLSDFVVWLRKMQPTAVRVLVTAGAVRIAFTIMLAIILVSSVLVHLRPELALTLAFYAIAVVTLTSSATLQRIYLLGGRAGVNVSVLLFSSTLGILYAFFFIETQKVYALIICEIAAHIVQIIFLTLFWRGSAQGQFRLRD